MASISDISRGPGEASKKSMSSGWGKRQDMYDQEGGFAGTSTMRRNNRNITLSLMQQKIGERPMGSLGFGDQKALTHMRNMGARSDAADRLFKQSKQRADQKVQKSNAVGRGDRVFSGGNHDASATWMQSIGGGRQFGGF